MDNYNIIIIDSLNGEKDYSVQDGENKIFLIYLISDSDHTGEVKIRIDGRNAKVQILGIIIASGKQKINLYTLQDHLQPKSISDLFIKSVLFDEAILNYKGLIKIQKNAQGSNAYQKNQNILMSDRCKADSRPYLEILANDVRCTHGVTIGKIDIQQLYYLQSRGLTQKQATQLLLSGFFREVTERIPDQNMNDKLNSDIDSVLEKQIVNKI